MTVPVVRAADGLHPVGGLPRTRTGEVRRLELPGALGP